MTYWALNAILLAVVAAVAIATFVRRRTPRWPAVAVALAVLLVLTAVFDNVMISIGLVDYDPARISGAKVGVAPLEDFAYALAAGILLPCVWSLLPGRPRDRSPRADLLPHPDGDGGGDNDSGDDNDGDAR